MGLAFAPFIVFALLSRRIGPLEALAAGALVSAVLVAREYMTKRDFKVLELGTFILFAVLALYMAASGAALSVISVRFWVDAGLFIVVVVSMVIGKPFTLQYARDSVPEAVWSSPLFIRTNYVITAVWALAFAIMAVAEAYIAFTPDAPQRLAIIVVIAALGGAFAFTKWYPDQVRKSAA